jgi:hypothetical protein
MLKCPKCQSGIVTATCPTCHTDLDFEQDQREQLVFTEGVLYFPSRTQFNDPFDCIAPDFSRIQAGKLEAFIRKRVAEEWPNATDAERKQKVRDMSQSPAEMERRSQEVADYLGVLSLTSKPDSVLMWSHYANSHKGFCLEFDTSAEPFASARKVQYRETRHSFDVDARPEETATNFLLAKHKDWEYEDEWRLIAEKGREKYQYPPYVLTGVIFGSAISYADKLKVKEWIGKGRSHPRCYLASLAQTEFALNIKPESS